MSNQNLEIRISPGRLTATNEGIRFEGVAVPYHSTSVTLRDRRRPYKERIAPGALKWTDDTVMLTQHDQRGIPLARVKSGTLRFTESDNGLQFEADLPESRQDIREALKRGDLDGSVSIGFVCNDDDWVHGKSTSLRTVRNADLVELSICTAGAYAGARGNYKES